MKRVYPMVIAICIQAVLLPRISFAQCTCSGGLPATPVTYNVTLAPSTAATSTISFPQFNPSIGTLSCLTLNDTLSGISTTHVTNTGSTKTKFKFQLTVASDLEGPGGGGISITDSYQKTYGPDSLDATGTIGDSITYGPDTTFNNVAYTASSTSTAPYLGTGTVGFTYTLNGGLISLQGGLNYNDQITTVYRGHFSLTYYWCPNVVLATSITDFTATGNGNSILLQWLTNNEQNNTNYEIQISTDGKQFSSVGEAQTNPVTAGVTSKYQYQYNTDPTNVGKLYFRIKETDASGKVSYSAVLIITPGGSGDASTSFQTYPNPATGSLVFQFNKNQTGHYLLELVNTAGQVVQQKSVTLTGTNQIRMDLNPHPSKGLYFMRTRDLTHNQSYVSKVLID